MHIVGEHEVSGPLHDLLVGFVRILRAKRRVANHALEHDRSKGPPITLLSISMLHEYLGGNVVRRPDS